MPVAFLTAGLLFGAFQGLRPYPAGGADTAAEFSSPWWTVAHLSGAAALVAFAIGIALSTRRGVTLLSALIGTGATLLYFGMETFALPLLATRLSGDALTEAAEQLRMSGPQVTVFGVGLILVAVAAIMFAVRLHRAGTVSTAAAIVFAAGWATILPQFFGGQPVRLAHGLLMVAGGLWLAADLHRSPGVTAVPIATDRSEAGSPR